MAQNQLSVVLSDLPLILAGPIVRRTQPDQVTVWLAVQEPRAVTLRVYAQDSDADDLAIMEGVARTVALGDNLHLVAVTARTLPPRAPLAWGSMAFYDLRFAPRPADNEPLTPAAAGSPGLQQENILVKGDPAGKDLMDRLLYPEPGQGGAAGALPRFARPNFVLPPADLDKLRLMHASCRKPHGEGSDMLAHLDTLVGEMIDAPLERPQMLLLTGDQIYADDVADALLAQLKEVDKALMGWQEGLPDIAADSEDLKPGHRRDLVDDKAEFTSDDSDSHLLTFGEFCAIYLLAWSPVLWPQQDYAALEFEVFFPGEEAFHFDFWGIRNRTDLKERFDGQKPQLDRFLGSLKAVRRALANISTYMIFDDHEVTDDWFLNLDWCLDVLGTRLGKRVINNGLLAYTIFQAWGNTPDQFAPNRPGAALLQTAANWRTGHTSQEETLPQFGLPAAATLKTGGDLWPQSPAVLDNTLRFDYVINGPPVVGVGGAQVARSFQIHILNSRTGRKFATGDWFFRTTPPWLLGPAAFASQLNPAALAETEKSELAIVVSPAPVVGVPWVENIQDFFSFWGAKAFADYEYWGLQEQAVQTLFSRIARLGRVQKASDPALPDVLATRAIVLCGDVHYGFAARIGYGNTTSPPHLEATIAQFTASSLKNQTSGGFFNVGKTLMVHDAGYAFWSKSLPEPDGERVAAAIDSGACYQPAFVRMEPIAPQPPPGANPNSALEKYVGVAQKHKFYAEEWADGKEVVGYNNLGEIRIEVDADSKPAVAAQILYWLPEPGQAMLRTVYRVSCAFTAPACD